MIRVRSGNWERADWAFARAVCCLTGNAGDPLQDRARWEFFGEQWIGPYERLRPEWAFLATEVGPGRRDADGRDADGRPALRERRLGYLTGCPDTARFERERRWLHDFPLALRTACGGFAPTVDSRRFLARFADSFRRAPADPGPEARFRLAHGADAAARVLADYPAHLHMNLVADARGKGVGRKLVDAYRAALAARGVRGIHLYCGPKPRAFYERVGFRLLDEIEFRPGVPVYRLGSRF